MAPPIPTLLFAVLLFLGMVAMVETGRIIGVRRRPKESEGERGNLGAVEGAIFAMFGLLIAFIFSGASSRFHEKRMLIVEEANAIEVAYLRLELVSPEARPPLQELVREYVDSRLETYHLLPDADAAGVEMAKSKHLQEEIWTGSVAATLLPNSNPDTGKLLLPALNNMIDMMNTRTMALQAHPPTIIFALQFCLALVCSLLAGYRMAVCSHRSWLHILGFTAITVIIAYVSLDMEYPRTGVLRLDNADQMIVQVRAAMK